MEEAGAISDRIAIMNEGRLRCYGSPEYLRTIFGNLPSKGIILEKVHIGS
jgi:ABC-type multidrug transport system ATPase subunit